MTAAHNLPAQVSACWGVDPELFFGPADSAEGQPLFSWERQALRVCASCALKAACLAEVLKFPRDEQYGVIGGMTAGQRQVLLRTSRRQPSRSSATDTARDRRWLMQAAVRLHQAGHGPRSIATRLEVGERQVQRWLAAHRTRLLAAADQAGHSGKAPKLPPEGVA